MTVTSLTFVFAENLRVALAEQGWTQEQLAREMPRANRTVAGWCLGERLPRRRAINTLARLLEREPHWFFVDHADVNKTAA